MRRRKPAPHGFAVNGNLNNIKRWNLTCRICCSPPGNLGNHAGRLAVDKPFTGSPKVLLITTQGRPAHLTCGQTIARIIIPRPRSWRKGQLPPLSGQNASARNQEQQPPSHKREAALALVRHGAFSCVARSGGNVPAWLVFIFQATRRTFLFPVRPIAQEKGRKASCFKKFFQFFSETYHSQVDCLLSEAGFLSNFITVKAGHFQKGNLDGELVLFG